jgi:hypothetical protein
MFNAIKFLFNDAQLLELGLGEGAGSRTKNGTLLYISRNTEVPVLEGYIKTVNGGY